MKSELTDKNVGVERISKIWVVTFERRESASLVLGVYSDKSKALADWNDVIALDENDTYEGVELSEYDLDKKVVLDNLENLHLPYHIKSRLPKV